MADDPWNRVEIPKPAIHCVVTVPMSDVTGKNIAAITTGCHAVGALLKNKVLEAEVKVLNSILYITHNPLGYHKTYLALKQVQQCLNRLTRMNLEGAIEEFVELCPNKKELENTDSCSAPSQPLIELVAVKILGGCKLFLRLMDCCCKAFHLTVQHLSLEEYMVLNLVVLGLLSRLWVLFRGILINLTSVYGPIYGLLQEVSSVQQMPYFKGFTFPSCITDFLDPAFSEIVKQQLAPKKVQHKGATGLLNKLFPTDRFPSTPGCASASAALKKKKKINRPVKQHIDVGQPVLKRRKNTAKLPEFDIKTLSKKHPLNPVTNATASLTLQNSKKCRSKPAIIPSSVDLKVKSLTCFVPEIQGVQSFKALSEVLGAAVIWCRSRKLKSKVLFLGHKRLKSNRLHHVESLGYSRKNKLRCIKASVCRYLLCRTRNAAPESSVLRKWRCIKSQRLKKNSLGKQSRKKNQKHTPEPYQQDNQSVSWSLTETLLPSFGNTKLISQTAEPVAGPHDMGTRKRTGIECGTDKDDIDDIFQSIGF
ncbi:nucleolus and neural progenitor protein [Ambystoma mexicanum]|uniref:nucleolus and neural progenitor protein n=1 Tax=Ambystoma mexicanum TaxID=8296 RepID=UPI0037E978BC